MNKKEKEQVTLESVERLFRVAVDDIIDGGCWFPGGVEYTLYYREQDEVYVMELWPQVLDPSEVLANESDRESVGVVYSLAELDFARLNDRTPDSISYSQSLGQFIVEWREDGLCLELVIHLQPLDEEKEGAKGAEVFPFPVPVPGPGGEPS